MSNAEMLRGIEDFIKLIIAMNGILILAFFIQLIANIILIFQLPKIKKYTKRIFEKLYDFNENKYTDEQEENIEETTIDEKENEKFNEKIESLENEYSTSALILSGITIGIIIVALVVFIAVNS